MHRYGVFQALFRAFLVAVCTCASTTLSQNNWAFPPDATSRSGEKITLEVGTHVQLEWLTNYVNESLWLWQSSKGVDDYDVLINQKTTSDTGTQLNWTVGTSGDLSAVNLFHLCLYDATNPNDNFNSIDFYITSNASTPVTTGLPLKPSASTLVPPTQTDSAGMASTVASSPTVVVPPIVPCSTNLPRTAIIGLGIGISFGTPLIFLAGFFIGWQTRSRNSRMESLSTPTSGKGSVMQFHRSPPRRNSTERPRIILIPKPASVFPDDPNRFYRPHQELQHQPIVRKVP